MKHCLRLGGLILGVAFVAGCGGKLESPPVPTEQDYEQQHATMEESIKSGEAAAAAAAGKRDPSGAASQ